LSCSSCSQTNGDNGDSTGSSTTAAQSSSGSGGGAINPCTGCGAPRASGVLGSALITEASGLAASHKHAGLYYVNNDSGDRPRFFAIDESGAERGIYQVSDGEALDWEGLAVGPCASGSCVYAGDIGDNLLMRSTYTVYRVREPAEVAPGDHLVPGETLPYSYPDGSHNAETLMAHPRTGELYVVTKVDEGASSLYRFPMPLTPGAPVTLEKLGDLTPPEGSPKITGGDIHPELRGVLLRTYTHLWFYPWSNDIAATLAGKPCSTPAAEEKQGETVAWSAAGDAYLTVSEGRASSLFLSRCTR
jgi:hypothetical protein